MKVDGVFCCFVGCLKMGEICLKRSKADEKVPTVSSWLMIPDRRENQYCKCPEKAEGNGSWKGMRI